MCCTEIRRFQRALLLLLALLVSTSSAFSQEEPDASEIDTLRPGPFVGISFGGGLPMFDGENLFESGTAPRSRADTKEEPSIGFNARAGWRFLSWAAAEVQYEWMNEFTVESRGEECANASAQVLTGNLKLYAPHHSFHPYLLGGVGAARLERESRTIAIGATQCNPNPGEPRKDRNWGFAARVGLGFDLYITEHVVLNIEGSGVHTEDDTLRKNWPYVSVSAGIQYRF